MEEEDYEEAAITLLASTWFRLSAICGKKHEII